MKNVPVILLGACFANTLMCSGSCGQDRQPIVYMAITLETKGISRAWLLPNDKKACTKRLSSGHVPGAFIPELGIMRLTGLMRSRDVTIVGLSRSPTLDGVDFSDVGLVDRDLDPLVGKPTLKHLILDGNALTDGVVDSIAGIPSLETINLHNTQISKRGLARLARRCPRLKIVVESPGRLEATSGGYRHIDIPADESSEDR